MPKLVLPAIRRSAYQSVGVPIGVVALLSLATLLLSNSKLAYAVLLGGFLWLLPNAYVALILFHRIETETKHFLAIFYRTELVKLTLIAVLFTIMVKWLSANPLGLFAGYFCAQIACWVVSLFCR